jgi:hypothetical protein
MEAKDVVEKKITLKKGVTQEEHTTYSEFERRADMIKDLDDDLLKAENLLKRVQNYLRSIAKINPETPLVVTIINSINDYFSSKVEKENFSQPVKENVDFDIKGARAKDFPLPDIENEKTNE